MHSLLQNDSRWRVVQSSLPRHVIVPEAEQVQLLPQSSTVIFKPRPQVVEPWLAAAAQTTLCSRMVQEVISFRRAFRLE